MIGGSVGERSGGRIGWKGSAGGTDGVAAGGGVEGIQSPAGPGGVPGDSGGSESGEDWVEEGTAPSPWPGACAEPGVIGVPERGLLVEGW